MGTNRAERRLAFKNGIKTEELSALRATGEIQPNERRIDKNKIRRIKKVLGKVKQHGRQNGSGDLRDPVPGAGEAQEGTVGEAVGKAHVGV